MSIVQSKFSPSGPSAVHKEFMCHVWHMILLMSFDHASESNHKPYMDLKVLYATLILIVEVLYPLHSRLKHYPLI